MRLINRPYYIFRPTQVVRRLAVATGRGKGEVTLPWGARVRIDSHSPMGSALARTGIYDIAVCEALHRLADEGELAVDVGANIGVMTSLLAERVGRAGEVVAVEPEPATSFELNANLARWRAGATVTIVRKALSDREEQAELHMSPVHGAATLLPDGPVVAKAQLMRGGGEYGTSSSRRKASPRPPSRACSRRSGTRSTGSTPDPRDLSSSISRAPQNIGSGNHRTIWRRSMQRALANASDLAVGTCSELR